MCIRDRKAPVELAARADASGEGGPATLDLQLEHTGPQLNHTDLCEVAALHSTSQNSIRYCLQGLEQKWRVEKHAFAREFLNNRPADADEDEATALADALDAERDRRARAAIAALGESKGFPGLAERWDLMSVVRAAERRELQERKAKREDAKAAVEAESPFRARASRWKENAIAQRMDAWEAETEGGRAGALTRAAIDGCRAAGLTSATYLLERDLEAPSADEMRARLLASPQTRPMREFTVDRPVIRIVADAAHPYCCGQRISFIDVVQDKDTLKYHRVESTPHKVTSASFGWRFVMLYQNWLAIFTSGIKNFVYFLLVGSLSLHAMFGCEPYSYQEDVQSHWTGTIYVKEDPKQQTFASRLRAVWEAVSESRADFESTPDSGLISKRMTRLLNIAWAYGVIGLCGTVLIFIFQPLLTVLNVALCSVMLIVWIPLAPVLAILIYAVSYTHLTLPTTPYV